MTAAFWFCLTLATAAVFAHRNWLRALVKFVRRALNDLLSKEMVLPGDALRSRPLLHREKPTVCPWCGSHAYGWNYGCMDCTAPPPWAERRNRKPPSTD